jgi:hypothetical protein
MSYLRMLNEILHIYYEKLLGIACKINFCEDKIEFESFDIYI